MIIWYVLKALSIMDSTGVNWACHIFSVGGFYSHKWYVCSTSDLLICLLTFFFFAPAHVSLVIFSLSNIEK